MIKERKTGEKKKGKKEEKYPIKKGKYLKETLKRI